MAFVRVAPQEVHDESGFSVGVEDRETAKYVGEDGRVALADVDFGPIVGVYADSPRWCDHAPMTDAERAQVLGRIVDGLAAMGLVVEVC